jgi:hypothetical protein
VDGTAAGAVTHEDGSVSLHVPVKRKGGARKR